MPNSFDQLPEILDARALKTFLGISQTGTYNLMHRKDFPITASARENILWLPRT